MNSMEQESSPGAWLRGILSVLTRFLSITEFSSHDLKMIVFCSHL